MKSSSKDRLILRRNLKEKPAPKVSSEGSAFENAAQAMRNFGAALDSFRLTVPAAGSSHELSINVEGKRVRGGLVPSCFHAGRLLLSP